MLHEYLRYVDSDIKFVWMSVANEVADSILDVVKSWLPGITVSDDILMAGLGYILMHYGGKWSSWLTITGIGMLERAIGSFLGDTVRDILQGFAGK